ncbi:MAG: hypothetical protein EBU14_06655, partial [Acetobacteraceae bacterium]|nr:hypothetical protein [Acetobacteraceae bacterium]
FGYLLAMDSPTAHPRGEAYHWGTTLWHEMAHVYTVEASNHLVPRWYTEGIAVFEEWRSGPTPGRKIPLNVYQAMSEGKFLPVASMDDGFMRPSYEDQVIVSYMQGGLIMDFIALEYGVDKIVDMLYFFRDGKPLEDAMQQVLGIDTTTFDKQFKEFIDIEYGKLLRALPGWQADQKTAFEALEAEDWQSAVAAGQRGVAAFPDYVEPDSPYIALARAYSRLDDTENQFRTLETFWQKGGYAPRALLTLAEGYTERGDTERAFDVLKTVQGGKLNMSGHYDHSRPGATLSGDAVLEGFVVRDAPGLGKVLQAMTLYGLVDALRGPGLNFSRATIPFSLSPDALVLQDARAFSSSLGLTAKGRIDRRRDTVDMEGTIVPAYIFNTLLGRIPLLGRLFSPEEGGGVFAVAYRMRGPLNDPQTSVNPLAALTPGFLRGIFGLGQEPAGQAPRQ